MFGLTFLTTAYIENFFYVFLRITGLILVSPVLGRRNFPVIFKIGLCLMLSYMVMSVLPAPQVFTDSMLIISVNGIKELLFGITLGFVTIIIFSIAVSAGEIIDMQIGFGMSSFFDPQLNIQSPISGTFLNIIFVLVFFAVNGHHLLIQVIFKTFETIKPGQVMFQTNIVQVMTDFFVWFVVIVIKVAVPVLAVSILIEVGLGIIIKTMPQLNVFVVGIPLKLFVGIFVLIVMMTVFVMLTENAFDQMLHWYDKLMQGLIVH